MRWLTSTARAAYSFVAGATYASSPFPRALAQISLCMHASQHQLAEQVKTSQQSDNRLLKAGAWRYLLAGKFRSLAA